MTSIRVTDRHCGMNYTYTESVTPSELELHGKMLGSGKKVTRRIYTDGYDIEYVRLDGEYYSVRYAEEELLEDGAWVHALDTYEEVIQYVKDIFGSQHVEYDILGIASEMFVKEEVDGHEEWHLVDKYRDRTGYGTDETWELADKYSLSTTYEFKYTRDVLFDEVPGLKPWQYDKLAEMLKKHWMDSLHEDIQDLLWIVKE